MRLFGIIMHIRISKGLVPHCMYVMQIYNVYCTCIVVCLILLASFFLPSHLSLKHVHVHHASTCVLYMHVCACPGIQWWRHSV